MTPAEIKTLCTHINGGQTIDETLLNSLLNQARRILFSERPWVFLRKTNNSIQVSQNNDSWNTAISISSITDFNRFFNSDMGNRSYSIILYNSATKQKEYYRQVPFSKRLEYQDSPFTFVYDMANRNIYLNSSISFSGNLYINYIYFPSTSLNVSSETDMDTSGDFKAPSDFHPILAYYAIGVNKGAVDYDSINREMLPHNQSALSSLKNSMVTWDNELQLNEISGQDPTGFIGYPVAGRINIS